MYRRKFLNTSLWLGAGAMVLFHACVSSSGKHPGGFFSVAQKNGRWWLLTPEGDYTFSIGLNHMDPAAIRHLASNGIWEKEYSNSMKDWLPKVKADLSDWGFNCVGWEQEVVIIQPEMHRHSRSFTFEEYQWEWETKLPDIKSGAFAEWCDYVAQDRCARFKDDPRLIGYFFTDCPAWIHSNENNSWKAPILDPALKKTESGRKEIFETASIYYKTIVDAI